MRYDEPRHVWEGFLSVFITTPVAVFFLSVSERAVSDVQTKYGLYICDAPFSSQATCRARWRVAIGESRHSSLM